MERMNPEVERLFLAKEHRRQQLAKLPFSEKVAMVIQLQRMVAPILRARGQHVRVWNIANTTTPGT